MALDVTSFAFGETKKPPCFWKGSRSLVKGGGCGGARGACVRVVGGGGHSRAAPEAAA